MFPSPCFVAPSGSPRGGRVNTARMPCGRLGKPASSPKAMLSLAPERMQMLTSPLRGPAQAAMSSGITKSFVDCANVRLFFQYTFIKPLLQPSPGLGIALESRVSNANEHCSLQVTTFFFFQVKFTLQKNQPCSRNRSVAFCPLPKQNASNSCVKLLVLSVFFPKGLWNVVLRSCFPCSLWPILGADVIGLTAS